MDIPIEAKVELLDGDGGHTTRVLVNPITRKITHLIVREAGLLGTEREVPLELVAESTPKAVRLRLTRDDLHARLESHLNGLGAGWADAELRGDTTVLESILADDFVAVGPRGFVLDKEQYLGPRRSGDLRIEAFAWSDATVREYGAAAIAVGTRRSKPPTGGGTPRVASASPTLPCTRPAAGSSSACTSAALSPTSRRGTGEAS